MALDVETLQRQIPFYLTESVQARREFLDNLKAFENGNQPDFIIGENSASYQEAMLQGDGWAGLQIYMMTTGELRGIKGLVLSNSCDVDMHNSRDVPVRIVFAPLLRLSAYADLLRANGVEEAPLTAKLQAIKEQKTSNIFYLAPSGPLVEEYIIQFDHTHSVPMEMHLAHPERAKLFTLSQIGFYLLTFKLSIHFCRMQENVDRTAPLPAIVSAGSGTAQPPSTP